MSTKTNKQIKKKIKEKKGEKNSFCKFKIEAGQIFVHFQYIG